MELKCVLLHSTKNQEAPLPCSFPFMAVLTCRSGKVVLSNLMAGGECKAGMGVRLTQEAKSIWSSKNTIRNSSMFCGMASQSAISCIAVSSVLCSAAGMLLKLGSHPIVSLSQRMLWCSSFARTLKAVMRRSRLEWKPPQWAMRRSPYMVHNLFLMRCLHCVHIATKHMPDKTLSCSEYVVHRLLLVALRGPVMMPKSIVPLALPFH